MGKASRDKGSRREREVVNHWKSVGVHAERIVLSGSGFGKQGGRDVDLYPFGKDEAPLCGEVKARKNGAGFKTILNWIGANDFLTLHADQTERLYVLPERVMQQLVTRRRT